MHPVPIRERSPIPSTRDADMAYGLLLVCAPVIAWAGGVPLAGCALTAFVVYEARWTLRQIMRWLRERD